MKGRKSLFYPPTILIIFTLNLSVLGNINFNLWNAERAAHDTQKEFVFFEIVKPPELEFTYKIVPAIGFGAPFNSSFSERNIGLVPVDPSNGCEKLKNVDEVEGKVALINRGECSFIMKTYIAEEAGAKAAIISDFYPESMEELREMPLWLDHYYIGMINDDSIPLAKPISIPAGFLLGKNGYMIRKVLKRLEMDHAIINIPVNLTYSIIGESNQPPWVSW